MIRKIFLLILCFCSLSAFAASDVVSQFLSPVKSASCDNTHKSSAPEFCAMFPSVAVCNCELHATPNYCVNMQTIYYNMMKMYHNKLADACNNPKAQTATSTQECIDDWNCYYDGGTSSTGKCNATGVQCTTDPRPTA